MFSGSKLNYQGLTTWEKCQAQHWSNHKPQPYSWRTSSQGSQVLDTTAGWPLVLKLFNFSHENSGKQMRRATLFTHKSIHADLILKILHFELKYILSHTCIIGYNKAHLKGHQSSQNYHEMRFAEPKRYSYHTCTITIKPTKIRNN